MSNENESENVNDQTSDPSKVDGDPDTSAKFKQVSLKGTDSERIGPHSLHVFGTVVGFRDGVATVDDALAKKLKKAGYVE